MDREHGLAWLALLPLGSRGVVKKVCHLTYAQRGHMLPMLAHDLNGRDQTQRTGHLDLRVAAIHHQSYSQVLCDRATGAMDLYRGTSLIKDSPPPWDHNRAQDIVNLWGPRRGLFPLLP